MKYHAIRGKVAAIKWSYFNAAAVEGYAVTREKQGAGWTATGALVPGAVDVFKLAQRPLFFVAPFKGGAWRWEIVSIALDGGRFTAHLGAMTVEGSNGLTRPQTRN